MLWFIVQLNRAFGLRGRVHTELAGLDQNPWQTQGKRKSGPWRRRGGPFGVQEANGSRCVMVMVTVSGSYICPSFIL